MYWGLDLVQIRVNIGWISEYRVDAGGCRYRYRANIRRIAGGVDICGCDTEVTDTNTHMEPANFPYREKFFSFVKDSFECLSLSSSVVERVGLGPYRLSSPS